MATVISFLKPDQRQGRKKPVPGLGHTCPGPMRLPLDKEPPKARGTQKGAGWSPAGRGPGSDSAFHFHLPGPEGGISLGGLGTKDPMKEQATLPGLAREPAQVRPTPWTAVTFTSSPRAQRSPEEAAVPPLLVQIPPGQFQSNCRVNCQASVPAN